MLEYTPKTHETLQALDLKQGGGETDQTEYLNQRLVSLEALKEKLEQNSSLLTNDEINNIIREIEQGGNSFGVMRDVIEQVLSQTNYLHDWVESGVVQDILDANLNTPFTDRPIKAKWGQKHRKDGGAAVGDTVKIKKEIPTSGEILKALAIKGKFPAGLRIFAHEIVHTYQSPTAGQPLQPSGMGKYIKERIFPMYKKIWQGPSGELKEVHARRQGDKSPGTHTSEDVYTDITESKYIGTEKKLYNVNEEKLRTAISIVDKLNALGISVDEIGMLVVNHGGWDKKSNTYKGLEERLRDEMTKKNLSHEDVDTLVKIDALERIIERKKVMMLVQEELQKEKLRNNISLYGQDE